MRIENPEIEIDPEEPFKADKLNRFESAEALTELLRSLEGPFVLGVHSTWGTGKTTFVRMWKQHLCNKGFHCLYFNAWESDFSYDPLIPFISEMQTEIVSVLDEEYGKAREYFEKAKRVGGAIVRRGIPVAAKIATAGILDVDEITEEFLAEFIAEFAQERVEDYEADKKTLEDFRENLEEFAAELSRDNEKPLVFFVDELDRCRPTYALELLERIKHLFNVPGIVFVLVLDKGQIGQSIKALYGAGMDVDGYLRRFINLEYQLPEASCEAFCNHLYQQFGFAEFFNERQSGYSEKEKLLTVFAGLAQLFNFSLRVQEQCFTQFSIALRTTPENYPLFPLFLAFLIALKAANPTLYDKFVKEEVSHQEVLNFVREQPRGEEFIAEDHGIVIEAYLASGHYRFLEMNEPVSEYKEKLQEKEITEEERRRYERIVAILENFNTTRQHSRVVDYLAKKVAISGRFSS